MSLPDKAIPSTSREQVDDEIDIESIKELTQHLESSIKSGDEEKAMKAVRQLAKFKVPISIKVKKLDLATKAQLHLTARKRQCLSKVKRSNSSHTEPLSRAERYQRRVSRLLEEANAAENLINATVVQPQGIVVEDKVVPIDQNVIIIEDDDPDERRDQLGAIYNENLKNKDLNDNYENDSKLKERRKSQNITIKNCEEYNRLKELEGYSLVPNFEDFMCPVCMIDQKAMSGVVLRDCFHAFCRECITQTVLMSMDVEIKCPYIDDIDSCESTLRDSEIKALLGPNEYEKYLGKSITQAENRAGKEAFHCQTPNCPGWCMHDKDRKAFPCPVCYKVNCITCKAIHEAQTCDDYHLSKKQDMQVEMNREKIEEMIKNGEAMLCPRCTIVITKVAGCDSIKCIKCALEICWVTRQARWGPRGAGDISGGCRCNVNGIRCHPKCRNCH